MFKIQAKKQFKKDLKKLEKDLGKLNLLRVLIDEHLAIDGRAPSDYLPHPLKGAWKPHWECHVTPDFLLIWEIDTENNAVILTRCGSHSELFGRKPKK